MADRTRVSWTSAGLDHVPAGDAWMDDVERVRIAGMRYTKRRTEALLARYTAKTAVALALGLDHDPASLGRITVRNAPDGAPEASVDARDAGIVIAMTDRADWAACTVLHGADRVGCDLELVEPRSAAFVSDYFTNAEREVVAGAPADERPLLANLIWSAKESALKVLRTGLRRDTRTVAVVLEPGRDEGWSPLVIDTGASQLTGWWIRYGEFVMTVAAAVATDPPVALVEPPPLASAVPSHRWLDDPLR